MTKSLRAESLVLTPYRRGSLVHVRDQATGECLLSLLPMEDYVYLISKSGQYKRYPNFWVQSPFKDPRFRLIPSVRRAIDEAALIACSTVGDGEDGFVLDQTDAIKPLELATLLQEAAELIIAHTLEEDQE